MRTHITNRSTGRLPLPLRYRGRRRLPQSNRRRRLEMMRNGPVISVIQLIVSVRRQCRVLLIAAIGRTAREFSQKPNTVSVTGGNFPEKVRFSA